MLRVSYLAAAAVVLTGQAIGAGCATGGTNMGREGDGGPRGALDAMPHDAPPRDASPRDAPPYDAPPRDAPPDARATDAVAPPIDGFSLIDARPPIDAPAAPVDAPPPPVDACAATCAASSACTTGCGTTGSVSCASPCAAPVCSPPAEACNLIDDDCNGTCDLGVGCRVAVARSTHPSFPDHLYTRDPAESVCCGYVLEAAEYFYTYPPDTAGLIPLHRCYRSSSGHHFYTVDATCDGEPGAVLEPPLGWISSLVRCGAIPLYRLSGAGDFLTTSASERDGAIAGGWIDRGVVGYVWSAR